MTQPISVFLVAGSLGRPSYTHALVGAIANRLTAAEGVFAQTWDLRRRPLPFADPVYHRSPEEHPDANVRDFVGMADAASAIVLATPIYHNGISGVLKNALDHLVIRHFHLKPLGLASHGSGRTTQAVEQLRIIVRGLLGHAIAAQVCTDKEDYASSNPTSEPMLSAAAITERVNRFCRELVVMAQLMTYARQLLI